MPGGDPTTPPGRDHVQPAGEGEQTRTAAADEPDGPAARAVGVLEQWEADRAAAYRATDPDALRALHVDGSIAGRRDVAVLRAYTQRGVRLDLRTVTDRLIVLVATPGRVVVRRRARMDAVARRAGERRVLPRQAARWQRLELVRSGQGWQLRRATESRGSPREPP